MRWASGCRARSSGASGLSGEQRIEVERAPRRPARRCGVQGVQGVHGDDMRERLAPLRKPGTRAPDVQLGGRPQRHEHVDARRVDQLGDVRLAQQVVDGAGHAHGLGGPQRDVGLGNGRQQERHARLGIAAQALECARGAAHLRHHVRVRQARGRHRRVGTADVGDGGARRVAARRVFQRVEHVRMRHEACVRRGLDAADVFQAADAGCCFQTNAPGRKGPLPGGNSRPGA
jgi:hypothetical protein